MEGWRPDRILLPYDGSSAANAAVAPAGALARRPGAELLVVQVGAADVGVPTDRGSLTMPRYVDQPQHEWPHWTDELLKRLACLCPGGELHAHLYVRGGEPAAEIIQLATEHAADLVVLAWKGVWTSGHATTLKAIVQDSPCPIMIVRARTT
jgi:nucleotide-binding universal stress UspA family protein